MDLLGTLDNQDHRVPEETQDQLVVPGHLDSLVRRGSQDQMEPWETLEPREVLDPRDLLVLPDRGAMLDQQEQLVLEGTMELQVLLEE